MAEKQYIRGDVNVLKTKCRRCGKDIYKNNPLHIVFFCSKKCRKEFRRLGL